VPVKDSFLKAIRELSDGKDYQTAPIT
jgi:hypothetical protein